jgi:DNA-binding CsgD family transcriptional regulator/GAF domain-containing protein
MRNRIAQIDELILKIHSAAFAPDGWNRIAQDLCQLLGATGASLLQPSNDARIKPAGSLVQFDAEALRPYVQHYGQRDLWYQGALKTGRVGVGTVNIGAQLVERSTFESSEFYNDYLRPLRMDQMLGVFLAEPHGDFGAVAATFYRSRDMESFSSQEADLLAHLARHLTVAVQNHRSVQSLRVLDHARGEALDAATSALFGLDAAGRVSFINREAKDLIRRRQWIRVVNGTLLPLPATLEAGCLKDALRQLARGLSFRFMIRDRATGQEAIVSGAPISPAESDPLQTGTTALVWLTPVVPNACAADDLAAMFRLTQAEKRLVTLLIAGDDLRQAALRLHISLHTARTQMKAVFHKTGLRSQTALLTFAARLSALRVSGI